MLIANRFLTSVGYGVTNPIIVSGDDTHLAANDKTQLHMILWFLKTAGVDFHPMKQLISRSRT
jgi:hypothetical protein